MIQEIARLNVEVERQDKAITDKLYEVGKLKQQVTALVEALEQLLAMAKHYKPIPKEYNPTDEDEEMAFIAMLYEQVEQALALVEGDK